MTLPMLQWTAEIEAFTHWLLEIVKPVNILEIGTGPGGLSELFCNVAEGIVVSVDMPNGSSTGISYEACARRNEDIRSRYPRFVGVIGDSHKETTFKEVERALRGVEADLLFIDGDHSYRGVTQDSDDYRTFVRPGGWIAFHDINADAFELQGVDVPRYWRDLQGEKKEFTVNGEWGGIGVIRV